MASETSKPIDPQLAVQILKAWGSSAELRAEFRSINLYRAFVQGQLRAGDKTVLASSSFCSPVR